MIVTTSAPIMYSSADGKKSRKEKKAETPASGSAKDKKSFLSKLGTGIGKVAKAIGKGVVQAEQWVVKESKVVAKGVKKTGGKVKAGAKKLVHHKDKNTGKDVFKKPLNIIGPPEASTLPASSIYQITPDMFVKIAEMDKSKPVTVSTDPTTGKKEVGQDYAADEVVATDGDDGNVKYFKAADEEGMSTQTKVLIGAGIVLGLMGLYFAFQPSGKSSPVGFKH